MKSLRTSVIAAAVAAAVATPAFATELTIAIVNNGHMINMQKVAEAYTADTGVKLNWVSLGKKASCASRSHLTQRPAVASTTSSTSVCRKPRSGVRPVGSSR